ncbi:MAG: YfhO family protein [Desulfobulbaceae bacterium]|nr:YfhO family protein [Desulfobulbaceae bacterium]
MRKILNKINLNKLNELPETLNLITKKYDNELVIFTIFIIYCFIYGDYLFSNKLFVHYGFTVDSITQFYPFYYLWIDKIRSFSFSPWSFQVDLGYNFFSSLIDLNPFDWLLILVGKKYFADFLPIVMLLKFLTAGLFFHFYLRITSISSPLSIIGAVLYTFCGYMVINVHWYHYPNYAVLLSVLLFLFERWLKSGRWFTMVFMLGFLALKAELQIFQLILFFLTYAGFRLAQLNSLNIKNYLIVVTKSACFYSAGILLSFYSLLPSIIRAGSEDRVGEALADASLFSKLVSFVHVESFENIIVIFGRFFHNDIWGAFGNYSGFGNYFEGPSVYSGILVPILLTAILFNTKIILKKGYFILLSVVLMLFLFPEIRRFGNAFASYTFKYQTLYISTFLIISIVNYLEYILTNNKFNMYKLGVVPLLLMAIIYCLPMLNDKVEINQEINVAIILLLSIYSIVFFSVYYQYIRKLLPYLLLLCVVFETAIWNKYTIEKNSGALHVGFMDRKESYYDKDVMNALTYIKNQDKGFYRIERDFDSGGLNDAMIQGYYGVKGYISASTGITNFYKTLEFGQYSPRLSSYRYGLRDRVGLHSFLGVKYYLSESTTPLPGYKYLKSFGTITLYINTNWLPLGFLQHSAISFDQFKKLTVAQKDFLLLARCVTEKPYSALNYQGVENLAQTLSFNEPILDPSRIKELRSEAFTIKSFHESNILGTITTSNPGMLAFSIPYEKGWQIYIDGKKVTTERVNIGFLGAIIGKGTHEIRLKFSPYGALPGMCVTIASLALLLLVRRFRPIIHAF